MTRKKSIEMRTVRITGPDCWLGDRLYLPGETATVPSELADEWILTERAVSTAEAQENDNWTHGR
jgi:hypothetical protein